MRTWMQVRVCGGSTLQFAAEIGADPKFRQRRSWPWAALSGNRESAGKQKSGKIVGQSWLRARCAKQRGRHRVRRNLLPRAVWTLARGAGRIGLDRGGAQSAVTVYLL